MQINIQNRLFQWTINRSSNRRTVQLRLVSPEVLEVAAPNRITTAELEALVKTKAAWILRQADKLEALSYNPFNAGIADGVKLLYRGKSYTLRMLGAYQAQVERVGEEILLSLPLDGNQTAECILRSWYQEEARRLFAEKTAYWAKQIGVQPKRVVIRDQKTRWGSCSSHGTVNFNWRVVMAPASVADYLVVHELCHMLHPNHSKAYWDKVESIFPDYTTARRWLKENGKLLSRIL